MATEIGKGRPRQGFVLKCMVGVMVCSGIGILASGCRHDHLDRITLAAGDANAVNKAIHTIDPWPPEAFKDYQNTNGRRLARGYRRYQDGEEAAVASSASRPTKGTE